jgi:hypothetical protein
MSTHPGNQLPPTHLGHDNDLMKIGNFLVMVFLLTVEGYKKEAVLRIWFFKDALLSAIFIVFGFVQHFMTFVKLTDLLLDIEEGKIGPNERKIALEAVYLMVNGEKPTAAFCRHLILGKLAAV